MGAAGSTSSSKDVEIGEETSHSTTLYRIWTHVYPCLLTKRRKCTLFVRQFSETDSKETRSFFENGIKTLLKLRHPYIVEYVNSSLDLKEVTLLTERVQVLDLVVDSLSPIEIHTGLTQILDALVFLHDKAGLSHNNLCPSSVFVALDGRWKLSGFECAQKLENSRHWVQTDFVRSVKLPQFAPAEDQLMLSTDIPPAARDAFAFGKLIAYVLPYIKDHLLEETITALEDVIKKLTDDDPSSRGELGSLTVAFPTAFTNKLSTMIDFLRHFHSKNFQQKAAFFESAASELEGMPKNVVGKRIVPLLLSRYVLLDETAHIKLLPYVLQPDDSDNGVGMFNQALFKRWVVPQVLRIFRVHEVSIRLALLSHFSRFVSGIGEADLEDIVLGELVLGMKDTNDSIVSASLRAMADLVSVLGGPTVTGLVHRKTFADGRPKDTLVECSSSGDGEFLAINSVAVSKTGKDPVPSSLSFLLEEDHSEFPDVTLKLVQDREMSSTSLEETNDSTIDVMKSTWDEAWESMDNDNNSSVEHSASIGLSSSVQEAEVIEENPPRTFQNRNSDTLGSGYGVPEIGKVISEEVEELVEPNYFVDMEPVVSSPPKLVIQIKGDSLSVRKANKLERTSPLSSRFVANAVEEESANLDLWEAEPIADWDAD